MADRKQTKKSVSMEDIAKRAGVSRVTVSRVIGHTGRISTRTRERVLRIAEEMGYTKSPLVSAVMKKVASSAPVDFATPIAFLSDAPKEIDTHSSSSYRRLIEGLKTACNENGFHLEVFRLHEKQGSDTRLNQILEARSIQGVIINVAIKPKTELNLNWQRLAAVTMGGRLRVPQGLPQVISDVAGSMNTLFSELQARGYQRIGVMLAEQTDRAFEHFALSTAEHCIRNLPAKQRLPIYLEPSNLPDQEAAFFEWFDRCKPDACIAPYPHVSQWLESAGITCPDDLGFACLNLDESRMHLSGTWVPRSEVTKVAVETVVQRLISGRVGLITNPSRIMISSSWNEGKTLRSRPKNE